VLPLQLQQLLLDSVGACPHKTALYAHLAGEEWQRLPDPVECCQTGQAVLCNTPGRGLLPPPATTPLTGLWCAGLLNVEHSAWVGQLVQLVVQQLAGGLAGPAASPAPRLLLRFLACLPALGVITHASLAQLLQHIVEAATAAARSGRCQAVHTGAGGGAAAHPHPDSCSSLACQQLCHPGAHSHKEVPG
jgi:hypothetical protein